MNSSDAVFTRQNPFPPESHLARTHYNPSRAKKIPKPQKKLALSPVRFSSLTSPSEAPPPTASLSLEDQHFLGESHRVVFCPPPSVKEDKSCSESWPSVDLGSSASEGAKVCPESLASRSQNPVTIPISGTREPSVLAKYIERFRNGRPQSREERQRSAADGEDGHTLWWMPSSPPSSSTPTQPSVEHLRGALNSRISGTGGIHSPDGRSQSCSVLSPTRGLLDLSVLALSESSQCEPAESEALQLQERARRLVQKSENSLSCGSSAVPISSEGLGSSDVSSPVAVDEPTRQPIIPSLMDSAGLLAMPRWSGGSAPPAPPAPGTEGSRLRPEDDILFQWRLRRKMEQAREWCRTPAHNSVHHHPLPSRPSQQEMQPSPIPADLTRGTSLSFRHAPEEVSCSLSTPAAQETVFATSTVPKPRPTACAQTCSDPVTYSHSFAIPQPTKERVTREAQTDCSVPQPHPRGRSRSLESSAEPCSKQQAPCSPLLQRSEGAEGMEGAGHGLHQTGELEGKDVAQVERGRRKTAPTIQKKKSDTHVGDPGGVQKSHYNAKAKRNHGRGQEGVRRKTKEPSRENGCHSRGQSSTGDVCSGDLAPPPSPIHNTLGQVVSEVLFPGHDSPGQVRTSCSSDAPRYSPLAPPNIPQPCDVIGELMQEAEDSDGLEFEDDSLLLVLRQQRKWVKEQICEVDVMLDELHED
ncbi:proline and serine-rich protein 3 isoform X2 [Brachyhypopomus gauderio]|uniref:proline and serine-rich protein 3 isoform X2 n=1 Tax=Brachyhypopomus gauderio TaxID=698409 RepID=UPI004040F493